MMDAVRTDWGEPTRVDVVVVEELADGRVSPDDHRGSAATANDSVE
jgi:hypothetical protein